MGIIGPSTSIASRPHRVKFQSPGPVVPDGDGGYTQTWLDLTPAWWSVSIRPATARDLERVSHGTVQSTVSHIVQGPCHPDVTTKSQMLFNDRVFTVTGVGNPEERGVEMVLTCVEVVA